MNKLKTFDSSYFIGKSHFEEDGTQNYSVFQPINRYFKIIANTDYVPSWESKGLSAQSIKPPTIFDNSPTLVLKYYGIKRRVKFTGSCLKQPKMSYTHGIAVNIYIVYELGACCSHNNDPTEGLEHTLTAEKIDLINFTVTEKKFCLSLYYNRANSYLFVNGTQIYKFKAKDSEIVVHYAYETFQKTGQQIK